MFREYGPFDTRAALLITSQWRRLFIARLLIYKAYHKDLLKSLRFLEVAQIEVHLDL